MTAIGAFRRVLVGFDGSPDAAEAVRAAAAVASRDNGHVVALCIVRRPPHDDGDDDHEQDDPGGELRQQAEALFGEIGRDQPAGSALRTSVKVVQTGGEDAGQVLAGYAVQHGFDILVLGRHGDGGRRKKLGRVADAAAGECGVPVLLLSAR